MSIVKMKKLTLVGLVKDKDKLFDAIIKSKAVQLYDVDDIQEDSKKVSSDREKLLEQLTDIQSVVEYVCTEVKAYNADNKSTKNFHKVELERPTVSRPFVEMSYQQFVDMYSDYQPLLQHAQTVKQMRDKRIELTVELNKLNQQLSKLQLYRNLRHPTGYYCDTASSFVRLGTVPLSSLSMLKQLSAQYELSSITELDRDSDFALVVVVAHRSQQQFIEQLSSTGFATSTIKSDVLPSVEISLVNKQIEYTNKQIAECVQKIVDCAPYVRQWEILTDYLELQIKKRVAYDGMQRTETTFVLQGYYPVTDEQKIMSLIADVSDDVVVYTDEVAKDEEAPTLVKNNKLVSNFEQVTNMYTPPKYHEVDPNPMMSFFYFIIFGLMVADMGYGLILLLAGVIGRLAIKQDTGTRRLLSLFGVCGVAAIGVGALYGSALSYPLYTGVLPDPSKYPTTTMVICLLFGIVHLMAGILLSAVKQWRNKEYVGAICVSGMWLLFFGGLFAFVLQAALQFMDYPQFNSIVLPSLVGTIGMYTMIGSLVIIVLCAGYNRKGFGNKLIAGFGSIYGILNYFGDVMSYIRIFGLMLSSAMMGVVINDMANMVAGNGVVGMMLSFVLLAFAHLFNLVIGVLGVYIHDGRLQYVEFFGKFYEGDGQLFVPFGSDMKHTLITDK